MLFYRSKIPFSLLIIDVDDFKNINDTLGHLAGDQILSKLADIIAFNIREVDIAARYGGEEFIVIYPRMKEKEASQGAERLWRKKEEGPCQTAELQ